MSAGGQPARRQCARGVTLFEALLVIALIGLLTGMLVLGSGMTSAARQRAAASLVVSSVRRALLHAHTTGRPARLVFDLDQQKIVLEETSSRLMLRTRERGPARGAAPTSSSEPSAFEQMRQMVQGPRAAPPTFVPVQDSDREPGSEAGRALGQGVRFRQVQTEHDDQPLTRGRAYLYFWPRGGTERAAIQLVREGLDPEQGVTILVSPLTGRATVKPGMVDLPQSESEEGYSEREEQMR